jgi:GT2 family glycosyltransferase
MRNLAGHWRRRYAKRRLPGGNIMSVGIVTVNWRQWELTHACLSSVRKSNYRDAHCYIVDNASGDGSLDHLAQLGDDVTLIANPTNAGWAGGNNAAIPHVLRDGHDFVLLLNNDALLALDALDALISAHEEIMAEGSNQAPILGAAERRHDGEYGFLQATLHASTGIPALSTAIDDAAREMALLPTAYANGAALFCHRSVFEAIGLFDRRFFLYYDEADWCFRAARRKHPIRSVLAAEIYHEGGATTGGVQSPLHVYFTTRNCLLFAEKHSSARQRAALARDYAWMAREYGGGRGRFDWPLRFLRDHDPAVVAFRHGVRDYLLRRFGNCPAIIRALGSQHVDQAPAEATEDRTASVEWHSRRQA